MKAVKERLAFAERETKNLRIATAATAERGMNTNHYPLAKAGANIKEEKKYGFRFYTNSLGG